MKGFLTISLISLTLTSVFASARRAKHKSVEGGWNFAPVPAVVVIMFLCFVLGLFGIVAGLMGPAEDRNVVVSIGAAFAVFAAVGWPKTVYWRSSGLSQRNWYGGWKDIPWQRIDSTALRRDGTIVVRNKSSKIALSKTHAGHDFFLQMLRERGLYKENKTPRKS